MSSRKPRPLNELIEDFIEDFPYRRRLKRGMILSLWPEIVGQEISSRTEKLYFKGSKLMVHISDPAWRHEIHMQRFHIAKKLNKRVKEDIVSEIVIRA